MMTIIRQLFIMQNRIMKRISIPEKHGNIEINSEFNSEDRYIQFIDELYNILVNYNRIFKLAFNCEGAVYCIILTNINGNTSS